MALLSSTLAMAWPMHGQNPQNTRQATVTGPSNPGLRWSTDISTLGEYSTRDQVDSSNNYAPLVAPDGTVIVRAYDEVSGRANLLGLDGDDGSLAWTIDGTMSQCAPAIDSDGRLWVLLNPNAHDGLNNRALRSYDPQTGQPLGDAKEVVVSWSSSLCHQTNINIGEADGQEWLALVESDGIIVYEIAGDTPVYFGDLSWNSLGFDGVARASNGAQDFTFIDGGLLIPFNDGDALVLGLFDLDSGNVLETVELPLYDDHGDRAGLSDFSGPSARILVDGDRAVVGFAHEARGNEGAVFGIDLNNFNMTWSTRHEARASLAAAGPTLMGLSGDTVVYNAERGVLFGANLASGAAPAWSGDIAVRELGANADFDVVTDSAGNIYTAGQPGTDEQMRMMRLTPGGTVDWQFAVSALPGNATHAGNVRIAGVTASGDLVLYGRNTTTRGHIHMVDNSGGLAERVPCVLPFDDVRPGATHADNICRLVELGVTTGVTATSYEPRGLVTREQMATFLMRALDLDPKPNARGFADVSAGSTHTGSIYAVRDAGIAQGTMATTYEPRANITREQMATFLMRAAGLDAKPNARGFADVSAGSTHTGSIYAVRDAGIAQGTTATTYEPRANVTREQMASFLIRMIDHIDG